MNMKFSRGLGSLLHSSPHPSTSGPSGQQKGVSPYHPTTTRTAGTASCSKRWVARAGRDGRIPSGQYDVVLSSGFLAFAHHSGFLQAMEDAGLQAAGVMGTSAGALTGSLYCAGYTPRQIANELCRDPPMRYLSPSSRPWQGGLLSFDGVVKRLRDFLPATFEELDREFAVGVVNAQGKYMLVDSGPLPEAVAASAAIPILFQSVKIPGFGRQNPFKDGGMVDRVGLKGWRDRRRSQLVGSGRKLGGASVPPCLVHVIKRSSTFSGADDVSAMGESDITTVHSPKSGVSLLNLGNYEADYEASVKRAGLQMRKLRSGARLSADRAVRETQTVMIR